MIQVIVPFITFCGDLSCWDKLSLLSNIRSSSQYLAGEKPLRRRAAQEQKLEDILPFCWWSCPLSSKERKLKGKSKLEIVRWCDSIVKIIPSPNFYFVKSFSYKLHKAGLKIRIPVHGSFSFMGLWSYRGFVA